MRALSHSFTEQGSAAVMQQNTGSDKFPDKYLDKNSDGSMML
jgi:hypothetical protein